MTDFTLPLVGAQTQRNLDAINYATKDQRFVGCLFTTAESPLAREQNIWVNKRPGLKAVSTTIASGKTGISISSGYGLTRTDGVVLKGPLTSWHDGASSPNTQTHYVGTTLVGTTTTTNRPEVYITVGKDASDNEIFIIVVSHSAAYYIGETGMAGGVTFTGDTHTNTTIDNVSSVNGLVIGQAISGTNIVAGTRITNIVGTTLTVDTATTGTTVGVTITRERMAKIIDADFPVPAGPIQQLNGYYHVAKSGTRNIYQSAVNSITSWAAADYLTVDSTPGELLGISKSGVNIIAHKTDCIEAYYNAGNPSGSVLSVDVGARKLISADIITDTLTSTREVFTSAGDFVFTAIGAVYLTVNNTTKKISTPIIEAALSYIGPANTYVKAFRINSKHFLLLSHNTGTSVTYWYDVELNIWGETGFSFIPAMDDATGYLILRYPSGDGGTRFFPWAPTQTQSPAYTDSGQSPSAYVMTVQTNRTDFGTESWKSIHYVDLLADTQASGTATLERSIDDGTTWTTLGTFDMTVQRKRINRLGGYKGQAQYRLTHSANTPFRASALKFNYTPGAF
jgi:hypothetical protein